MAFDFNKDNTQDLIDQIGEPVETEYNIWSSDPIPDFWERLPEKITDPETGEIIMMSQTKMKRLLEVIEKKLCGVRYYETSITRNFSEHYEAAKFGNRFEYLVTGSLGRYDSKGNVPFMNEKYVAATKAQKMATGEAKVLKVSPTADETRIRKNAEVAKTVVEKFHGKEWEEGVELTYKCIDGETDIITDKPSHILMSDLKYTGLLDSDFGPLAWPKDISKKRSHIIQGTHYSILAEKIYGKPVKFFFLVFNAKNKTVGGKEVFGHYRAYELRFSEAAKNQHKHMVLNLIEQLQRMLDGKEFNALPSYEGCKKCPVSTCKLRKEEEEIVIIEL